jgi:hypothetical protein
MKRSSLWFTLATATVLSGCGSTHVSDGGSGSGTFSVDANVSATDRITNATDGADFDVDFSVRLTKNGNAVHGATVTIDSGNGQVALVENNQNGHYDGAQSGYAGTYHLSAVLGDDKVEGVILSGPGAHHFATPSVGDQHVYGQPLDIAWSPTGAQSAVLETNEIDHTAITDNGSYTIPASGLKKPDPGKTEDERIRITRSNSVALSGAVAGSTLSVSVRNEVTLLIVNP